jgi:sulfur relay (sulfurtransferase) DsrC/TusE family protein
LKKNFEKKKIELEQQRVLEEQKRMIEYDQTFYIEFKKNIERRRQLIAEQKEREDKENLEQLFKKVHHNGKECTIM